MKLLASGNYRYWRDGSPQPVDEPWTLSSADDGLQLRGQRLVGGKPALEVTADYTGCRCTSMILDWHATDAARRVRYARSGQSLRWFTDNESKAGEHVVVRDGELFPLLRAGAGPLLHLLLESPRTIIVPDIRPDATAAELLTPRSSERRAVLLGKGGSERHCRYYGGEYGEQGSDYWLDTRGLLLRYRWESPQGLWEARLEDLHVATEFSGFGPR